MKSILWLFMLLPASGLSAAEKLLYQLDLNTYPSVAAVKSVPAALIRQNSGERILMVKAASSVVGGKSESAVVKFPLDTKMLDGKILRLQADLRVRDLVSDKKDNNRVKFILYLSHESKEFSRQKRWTACPLPAEIQDWKTVSFTIRPFTAQYGKLKEAVLLLGIQGNTGEAEFKNVIVLGEDEPVITSTLQSKEVKKARYTVNLPRGRGFMSAVKFQADDFRDLASTGANLVRWQLHPPRQVTTVTQFRQWFAGSLDELDKVLSAAEKHHLMVVIDLHPMECGRFILEKPEAGALLVECWTQIVTRFKGRHCIWGYDLLNEPSSKWIPAGCPDWPELAYRTAAAIRRLDPVTPIIVEPDYGLYPGSNMRFIEYMPVFEMDNIYYSPHIYWPIPYTHQGLGSNSVTLRYPDEKKGWDKEGLRQWMEKIRAFQLKTGARIYVGEFSVVRWAPGGEIWLKDMISIMEEYNWDWTYHAFREYDGWSIEHGDDRNNKKTVTSTKRQTVLFEGLAKNRNK